MRWGPEVRVVQREDAVVALFVLAYLPCAWFRVIDKRRLALPQVKGDLSRGNLDPRRQQV